MKLVDDLTHKAYLQRQLAFRTRNKAEKEHYFRKAQEYLDAAGRARKEFEQAEKGTKKNVEENK